MAELGNSLIVHADFPQKANQSGAFIEYKDICTQCHRRVMTENTNVFTQRNPKGLNILIEEVPAIDLLANWG